MRSPVDSSLTRAAGSIGKRLLPDWLRNPAGILVIVSALMSVYCALLLAADLGRPFGGFASRGEPGVTWAKMRVETPPWWPIYGIASNVDTDLLDYRMETIDGLPYNPSARDAFARANAQGRKNVVISGTVHGNRLVLELPLFTFDLAAYTDLALPIAITGLVFLLLAVEVLRARPDSPLNRSFAIITSLIVVQRWVSASTIWQDARLSAVLATVMGLVAASYIGWGTVDFASRYPSALERARRWPPPLFFIASTASAVLMVVICLLWPPRLPDDVRLPLILAVVNFVVVLYVLALLFLIGRLAWSWRNERVTRRQRRASGIVLIGLAFASPMLALLAIVSISPAGVPDFFFRGLDLRYLLLAIPISFAYVIIRYQAFQAPSRLFVFVIVLSVSAVIAALAAWIWSLAQPIGSADLRPPFARLFTVALFAGGFWTIASGGRGWFGRFWNWERHSYDAARAFGRRVMGDTDLRRLPQTIADALVDELELESAAVWLWAPAAHAAPGMNGEAGPMPPAGAYELRATAGPVGGSLAEPLLTPPGFVPMPAARRVTVNETESSRLRPLGDAGFEVVVPLAAGGMPIGLLGLGRRWDEEIFDDRDLAVADLVGQQATLFILAAQQVEELRRVPGRLAEAQERERLNLARELHDTTQQFLGRLPFYLAISRAMIDKDPGRAAEMLDTSMDDAEQAARVLRSIRVNLAPNMLETSLIRPLQGLINHVQQRSGLVIQLVAPDDLDSSTTTDTRHVLYRVIQQALDNAVLHADATEICVTLSHPDSRVVFSVSDNGRGIEPAQVQAAAARGSFGFVSMQTRIESVGGEFTLESAPGRGTVIGGSVPAAG